MSKSVAWFDRGVEAIRRISSVDLAALGLHGRYLCPLCIRGIHREDADNMTLEDAPPRALGGRKVALTCPNCNHSAGFRLDAHMVKQANFERGWTSKPLKTSMTVGGVTAKIALSVTPGEIQTNFGHRNSPQVHEEFARQLNRVATYGNEKIELHIKLDHDSRLAFIGWLRAAYIIAFAAFGYSYVLQPELDVVRRQIQDPKSSLIPDVFGDRKEDSPSTQRIAYTRDRHRDLDVVVVQFGTRLIFLPGFSAGVDVYDYLAKMPSKHDWTFTEIDWPREPTHWLDFAEPRPRYPRLVLQSRPPEGVAV